MTVEERIYKTATGGTPVNPAGVPSTLANLIVAQAKHETGNFTSNFFKKYNNAFGYSYVAGARYQLPKGGTIADNGLPIAAYKDVEDSTREIVDWIYRRKRGGMFPDDLTTIQTPEQYANLLKGAGYYGDSVSNYLRGLKNYFINSPAKAATGTIIFIAAIFLIIKILTK